MSDFKIFYEGAHMRHQTTKKVIAQNMLRTSVYIYTNIRVTQFMK